MSISPLDSNSGPEDALNIVKMDHGPVTSPMSGFADAPRDGGATDWRGDPITSPMLHNATHSSLTRLSDEILLCIMSQADDVSILCLRRTCRKMLRLVSGPEFRHLHAIAGEGPEPRDWNPWFLDCFRYPRERVPEEARDQLGSLLRKDMYCEMCRTVGEDAERKLREESLYCSGCKRSHPAGLFSFRQRRGESERSRICIGREGYLKVCQHLVLRWAHVERNLASQASVRTTCNDPSHECPWPLAGHVNESPLRQFTVDMKRWKCSEYQQHGPTRTGRNRGLAIRWNVHLTFPGLGHEGGLEFTDVLERIEWARRNGASYIFQGHQGKLPTEMAMFDPNTCLCIRHPSPPPGMVWNWTGRGKSESSRCQKHGQSHSGNEVLYYSSSKKWRAMSDFETNGGCIMNQVLEHSTIKRCAALNYCLSFTYERYVPFGPTKFLNCKGVVDHETGKWTDRIQPWWAVWFMALDPESISLRDDEDSRGVYWCDTQTCLNYYANHKFNRKRWALDPTHIGSHCLSGPEKRGFLSRLKSVFGKK